MLAVMRALAFSPCPGRAHGGAACVAPGPSRGHRPQLSQRPGTRGPATPAHPPRGPARRRRVHLCRGALERSASRGRRAVARPCGTAPRVLARRCLAAEDARARRVPRRRALRSARRAALCSGVLVRATSAGKGCAGTAPHVVVRVAVQLLGCCGDGRVVGCFAAGSEESRKQAGSGVHASWQYSRSARRPRTAPGPLPLCQAMANGLWLVGQRGGAGDDGTAAPCVLASRLHRCRRPRIADAALAAALEGALAAAWKGRGVPRGSLVHTETLAQGVWGAATRVLVCATLQPLGCVRRTSRAGTAQRALHPPASPEAFRRAVQPAALAVAPSPHARRTLAMRRAQEMVSATGWDSFLEIRARVFVMQSETQQQQAAKGVAAQPPPEVRLWRVVEQGGQREGRA